MIYLDNAATTYPKPYGVLESLRNSPVRYGANPGRGGYKMSENTAEEIFKVRTKVKDMFGAESEENVVFTSNCTHSLNIAIKGMSKVGGHAVTSCLEHNSVMRPLNKIKKRNFDMASVDYYDDKTLLNFERLIKKNTDYIVCTYASNVFGDILPIRKIGELAESYGIPLIVDAAQAGGVIDIDMKRDKISCLCLPGHKGLYGPTGTGIMIIGDKVNVDSLFEGGTGSESMNINQPDFLPDKYESGTVNTVGIIALGKGIDYVNKIGIEKIRRYESDLIYYLKNALEKNSNIYLYNNYCDSKFVPVLSFNVKGKSSEEVASRLGEMNICVRGGFHCNPNAHKFYNTDEIGTVRVSVSSFNTIREIEFFINCINKIAKEV